ncbi:hypothetical protein [Microtetraspora sp. NBRC 13810]|uniref:hypothetical protein n=1 Tax=Microtetraspora sp. NBRC 13810 TaxID=3030990 RepID=UPI002556F8BB|nr:hypothetical protein [Microtetraspora sp. NBRC 13810]
MNTSVKIGAYVVGLAVIFGGAFGIGGAVGEVAPAPVARGHDTHPGKAQAAPGTGHATHAESAPGGPSVPGGLQISQNGYTLVPAATTFTPGEPAELRFTVLGPGGEPVTAYRVEHDKKLHLIVASRDLSGFTHIHPELSADGTWSVELTLPRPGAYRMFADFAPDRAEGMTLGADLHATGDYEPKPLPRAVRTATVDGYTVELRGDLVPGRSSRLTLKVSKDGEPVTDLQPYLGAYGHLVALRAGDLAYLHVHPDGEPGDGTTRPGPEITFYAEVPSRGDYRLFLDFQHDGKVRTADFTARSGPATVVAPEPGAVPSGAHDDDHTH